MTVQPNSALSSAAAARAREIARIESERDCADCLARIGGDDRCDDELADDFALFTIFPNDVADLLRIRRAIHRELRFPRFRGILRARGLHHAAFRVEKSEKLRAQRTC